MSLHHTPGPWRIMGSEIYCEDEGRHAGTIALLGLAGQRHNLEQIANARLITAAPKLLEACRAQHEAIDRLFGMLIEASPKDNTFLPTRSGQPWKAAEMGHDAITAATGEDP